MSDFAAFGDSSLPAGDSSGFGGGSSDLSGMANQAGFGTSGFNPWDQTGGQGSQFSFPGGGDIGSNALFGGNQATNWQQPANVAQTGQSPATIAQQQQNQNPPPTGPTGQPSGTPKPAWMDSLANLLLGLNPVSSASAAEAAPAAAAASPPAAATATTQLPEITVKPPTPADTGARSTPGQRTQGGYSGNRGNQWRDYGDQGGYVPGFPGRGGGSAGSYYQYPNAPSGAYGPVNPDIYSQYNQGEPPAYGTPKLSPYGGGPSGPPGGPSPMPQAPAARTPRRRGDSGSTEGDAPMATHSDREFAGPPPWEPQTPTPTVANTPTPAVDDYGRPLPGTSEAATPPATTTGATPPAGAGYGGGPQPGAEPEPANVDIPQAQPSPPATAPAAAPATAPATTPPATGAGAGGQQGGQGGQQGGQFNPMQGILNLIGGLFGVPLGDLIFGNQMQGNAPSFDKSGQPVNPQTGQPYEMSPGYHADPNTGMPVKDTPATGQPNAPATTPPQSGPASGANLPTPTGPGSISATPPGATPSDPFSTTVTPGQALPTGPQPAQPTAATPPRGGEQRFNPGTGRFEPVSAPGTATATPTPPNAPEQPKTVKTVPYTGPQGGPLAGAPAPAFTPQNFSQQAAANGMRTHGQFGQGDVRGMIIHHTNGNPDANGVTRFWGQQGKGYGSQFFVDRAGKVYQLAPDGARTWHAGGAGPAGPYNAHYEGVEVSAKNDRDVTPAQQQAVANLVAARAAKWGYDPTASGSIYGHGEIAGGGKEADEGRTIANGIRNGTLRAQGAPGAANATTGPQGGPQAGAPTGRMLGHTRGDRNNNPGNIKGRGWPGQTGSDSGGHAIFSSPQEGAAAQAMLLRRRYNNMTVPEMQRAGYAENPGWARDVMRAGGFSPNERLYLDDPGTMQRLQRAIWRAEGTHPPDDIFAYIQSRQSGGPVQAGQPYMVGEQGPEVVVPQQSGQVISNQAAKGNRQTPSQPLPEPVPPPPVPNTGGVAPDLTNEQQQQKRWQQRTTKGGKDPGPVAPSREQIEQHLSPPTFDDRFQGKPYRQPSIPNDQSFGRRFGASGGEYDPTSGDPLMSLEGMAQQAARLNMDPSRMGSPPSTHVEDRRGEWGSTLLGIMPTPRNLGRFMPGAAAGGGYRFDPNDPMSRSLMSTDPRRLPSNILPPPGTMTPAEQLQGGYGS